MTDRGRMAFKDTPAGMYLREGPATLVVDGSFMTYFCHSRLIAGAVVGSKDGPWPVHALVNWVGYVEYFQKLGHRVHVVWDAPFDSLWRLKLYPDYKRDRREADAARLVEKAYINGVLAPLVRSYLLKVEGVTQWWCSGYEADDLVADVLNEVLQEDRRIGLITADTDWEQFVSDRVSWISLKSALCTKGSPRPESLWQVKALTGDSADSIKGLVGIGSASAVELAARGWSAVLDQFGSGDFTGVSKAVRTRAEKAVALAGGAEEAVELLRLNAVLMALKRDDQVVVDAAYPKWTRPVANAERRIGRGISAQARDAWFERLELPGGLTGRIRQDLDRLDLEEAAKSVPWVMPLRRRLGHEGGLPIGLFAAGGR